MDKSYVPAFSSELKYLPTSSFRRCSVAAGTTSFWVMMAFFKAEPHLQPRVFGIAATASRTTLQACSAFFSSTAMIWSTLTLIVLLVPAVVIRDHGDGDIAQLSFAGQPGLREVGHADHVHAPTAIQIRLRFGRELRPFHVQVGAALLDIHAGATASLGEHFGLFFADGMPKTDVDDQPIAEEGVDTVAGAIDKLIRDDEIQWPMLFLQRADRRQRNDPRQPQAA